MPGGNGTAGSGAKGFASGSGEGDGVGVCAIVRTAKKEHKAIEAISKRIAK
jgi:hypothetical protein